MMPAHFERLSSVINKIPADLDFGVPKLSQSFELSHNLEHQHPSESTEPDSLSREPSQLSIDDAGETTPGTSFTGPRQKISRKKRMLD